MRVQEWIEMSYIGEFLPPMNPFMLQHHRTNPSIHFKRYIHCRPSVASIFHVSDSCVNISKASEHCLSTKLWWGYLSMVCIRTFLVPATIKAVLQIPGVSWRSWWTTQLNLCIPCCSYRKVWPGELLWRDYYEIESIASLGNKQTNHTHSNFS